MNEIKFFESLFLESKGGTVLYLLNLPQRTIKIHGEFRH